MVKFVKMGEVEVKESVMWTVLIMFEEMEGIEVEEEVTEALLLILLVMLA